MSPKVIGNAPRRVETLLLGSNKKKPQIFAPICGICEKTKRKYSSLIKLLVALPFRAQLKRQTRKRTIVSW
jgi:hypothetical protein